MNATDGLPHMNATDGLPRLRSVEIVHTPDDTGGEAARESLAQTAVVLVRELWTCRDLLVQLTLRDLRVRYRQAVLGVAWALLVPALIVLAGCVVKHAAAQTAGTLAPGALAAVIVKALPWGLFAGAVGFATTSLTNNLHLVTRIYFPREVLPLACLLTQLVDTLLAAGVAGVALMMLGAGTLSAALLWVVPLVLLALALTAGACLALSCANLFYRDVRYLVQVLLTFGIFFTPVFFDLDQLGPTGVRLALLNPLTPILEGLRLAICEQHNLCVAWHAVTSQGEPYLAWHPAFLLVTALWAGPGTLAAWVVFHRLEAVYAEQV